MMETNRPVTTKYQTSSFDDYQIALLPNPGYHEYRYFPFQENPQIATHSASNAFPNAISDNFLCWFDKETGSATAFFVSDLNQQFVSSPNYSPICEQNILYAGQFYTLLDRIQTQFSHQAYDVVSSYIQQASSDLQIEKNTIAIFNTYLHEEFDADIAYEFTNSLELLIKVSGKPVIHTINNLFKKLTFNDEIISETLKALGRIEDENTKNERYELLINSINNKSPFVRDGAVSGLSFLDDKRALLQLRMLLETEGAPILKNNIKVAIQGLETN